MPVMKIIDDYISENNAPMWMPELQNVLAALLPDGHLTLALEQLSGVSHTCNPCTWETEAGRLFRA